MKKYKLSNILIGILFTLTFLSIGVIAALNFRFIYYWDIDILNIPKTSGYSKEVILENYNALIDYNSPFFKGELAFPSLPSSSHGLIHFQEVKTIFVSFYYIGFLSVLALAGITYYKHKKKDYLYLRVSAVTVLVVPVVTALFTALNFDATFVFFHKIFFRNDYWLFDPATDPVINILPDIFFLHCLIVIIIFIIVGSMMLFSASRIIDNRRRKSLLITD
ncbi:MAG: TIGR01906 family membrane protein [Anaerocolumna sp.]